MNREPKIYFSIGAILGCILTYLITLLISGTTNNSNERPSINYCVISEEYMNNCKTYADKRYGTDAALDECCYNTTTYEAYMTKQVNETNFIKTYCSEKGAKHYTNKQS